MEKSENSTGQNSKLVKLQQEQVQLVKIQKEMNTMMNQVSETINELKVDELQLKSNELSNMRRTKTFSNPIEWNVNKNPDEPDASESELEINSQKIILDPMPTVCKKYEVEEDDE